MSPGELAVWAAEYVRALAMDLHPSAAARMAGARMAGDVVRSLRDHRTRGMIATCSDNARDDLLMLSQVLGEDNT